MTIGSALGSTPSKTRNGHRDGTMVLIAFRHGLRAPLLERTHPFEFGDEAALPNVLIPVPGGNPTAEFITTGLRAIRFDDPRLRAAAEYNPSDLIFWLDMPTGENDR